MPKHDIVERCKIQYVGKTIGNIRHGDYLTRKFTVSGWKTGNKVTYRDEIRGCDWTRITSMENKQWILDNLPEGISKDDLIFSELRNLNIARTHPQPQISFRIFLYFPDTDTRRYIVGLHSGSGEMIGDAPIESFTKPYFNSFNYNYEYEIDDALDSAREAQQRYKEQGKTCIIKMEELKE